MKCYGQINQGNWCQETYETASRDAGRRARQLRKSGFQAHAGVMGSQVTSVGMVKLTMLTILPGSHSDTLDIPKVDIERI